MWKLRFAKLIGNCETNLLMPYKISYLNVIILYILTTYPTTLVVVTRDHLECFHTCVNLSRSS